MLLLQMTGLSGAGKTTLSNAVHRQLTAMGYSVECIDGDVYRRAICPDLGFSKADRTENIRRLGFVGLTLIKHRVIVLFAAINPYEVDRARLSAQSDCVKTIYICCPLPILEQRDTKGLYRRARLPREHIEYVPNFTGVSDPYEIPSDPDLTIHTDCETMEDSTQRIVEFVLKNVAT